MIDTIERLKAFKGGTRLLARRTGLPVSTIHQIRHGKSSPRLCTLQKIDAALDALIGSAEDAPPRYGRPPGPSAARGAGSLAAGEHGAEVGPELGDLGQQSVQLEVSGHRNVLSVGSDATLPYLVRGMLRESVGEDFEKGADVASKTRGTSGDSANPEERTGLTDTSGGVPGAAPLAIGQSEGREP